MAENTATKKTTAKKAATKKTAAKATTAEDNKFEEIVENATSQLESVSTKAQEQYFSLVEQGQEMALDSLETIRDTVARIEVPAIPGIKTDDLNLPTITLPQSLTGEMPRNMVNAYFEFAEKALANQRQFAEKALALATKR